VQSTSGTECKFDGVLFDSDYQNRGSNTSIDSAGSVGSNNDYVPTVSVPEEEVAMTHANG
jgi:hypothetical protein